MKENLNIIEESYTKALEIYTHFYDARHSDIPLLYLELGKVYFLKSRIYIWMT